MAPFFFGKSKKAPLTPDSIPPLPSTQETNQHFATTHEETALNDPKHPSHKKQWLVGALVLNVFIIAIVLFVGNRLQQQKQPVTVQKPQAQAHAERVCGVITEPTDDQPNGATYTTHVKIRNTNPYPVDVDLNLQTHYCVNPNSSQCQENGTSANRTIHLEANDGNPNGGPDEVNLDPPLSVTNPHGACGSFQNDIAITNVHGIPEEFITPKQACQNVSHPAWGFYSYGSVCPGGTVPPVPSPTSGIVASPTPPTVATPTPPQGSPGPSPTTGAGRFHVGGEVINILLSPTPVVPGAPYTAQENLCFNAAAAGRKVSNVSVFITNGKNGSPDYYYQEMRTDAGGGFYFYNVPAGNTPGNTWDYSVCLKDPLPTGTTRVCTVPQEDQHNPFNASCIKLVQLHTNKANLKLVIRSTAGVNPTPTATPIPGATATPTPTGGGGGTGVTPSPTPTNGANPSPTPTGGGGGGTGVTPSPSPTNGANPTPTTGSGTNPTPTATPTPTPTSGSNPYPTPTPTRVYVANPTPTEVILVQGTTPGAGNGYGTGSGYGTGKGGGNGGPTIPSAGVPVPVIIVAVPLLLIFLAFLL